MYWVQAQKPFEKKKSEHNDTVRDRATDHLIVEFILDVLYVKMPIILGKHTFLAPLFRTEWTLSALVSSVILVYASTFYRLKIIMIPSEDTTGVEGNYTTLCSKFYTWYLPQREP